MTMTELCVVKCWICFIAGYTHPQGLYLPLVRGLGRALLLDPSSTDFKVLPFWFEIWPSTNEKARFFYTDCGWQRFLFTGLILPAHVIKSWDSLKDFLACRLHKRLMKICLYARWRNIWSWPKESTRPVVSITLIISWIFSLGRRRDRAMTGDNKRKRKRPSGGPSTRTSIPFEVLLTILKFISMLYLS